MTIQQLTTDLVYLESLNDQQIEDFFRPKFDVVRPVQKTKTTLTPKVTATKAKKSVNNLKTQVNNLSSEKKALLEQFGFDHLLKP